MSYIMALDQGTTSSRAILFDRGARIVAAAQREFPQIYPRAGWVEHDPEVIWTSQLEVAREVLAKTGVHGRDLIAIGIANQRETTVAWDRKSGLAIHNAIVWQDRRTAEICDNLHREGHAELVRERAGLIVDAYFAGTKVAWILDHVPGARARAERGEIAVGTIDAWLVHRLTGGRCHITDVSNASRTMLFDIHRMAWDEDLCRIFRVPPEVLPRPVASSEVVAKTDPALFGSHIPIAGIAGDQQAALFGQTCFSPNLAKTTYGTGCFLLINVGDTPRPSRHKLLSTVAWQTDDNVEYALEGSVFIGGAVVQWLRDGLGLIHESADIEALARSVPDNGGVYLVPAFAGLGAPHWDQYARGTIAGLTRGTTAGHFARAALEGIAYQVRDVLAVMQEEAGSNLAEMRADGGAAANDLLLQFQADILGMPVVRPWLLETTALGAAYLAGLSVGFWRDREELRSHWREGRRFLPGMSPDGVAHRLSRWREALERARDWELRSSVDQRAQG